MSDLYLVLRERIEEVSSWHHLGKEVLREAQQALGLSDEKLAREIPVSTRTWIRWKDRGAVPAQSLDRVAAVLGLEIERRRPPAIEVLEGDGEEESALEEQVRELAARQSEVIEALALTQAAVSDVVAVLRELTDVLRPEAAERS
jgi:hypothetical protein